jgi:glycosyltransferase involved in cell wall biosynthesis
MVHVPMQITIVIPVLNEEAVLDILVEGLASVMGDEFSWTILFVDDGSSDRTLAKLKDLNARDPRFTAISFSRNFGKESAIAAGLRYARGDAVILMDSDLQHPPHAIPTLIQRWCEGYQVVFGTRISRQQDRFSRKVYSHVFYAIFRRLAPIRLPMGIVDFLLLDRKAVNALNCFSEKSRFSKGLYSWIGFRSTVVPFVSNKRRSNSSKWNFFKLVHFALDGFISFTNLPLKVWSYMGALISAGALAYAGYFFLRTLIFSADVPGFPSLIVSIMFFAGIQLVSLGVIGEYLARIYEEVKARPLYIIAEEVGLSGKQTSVT